MGSLGAVLSIEKGKYGLKLLGDQQGGCPCHIGRQVTVSDKTVRKVRSDCEAAGPWRRTAKEPGAQKRGRYVRVGAANARDLLSR